MRKDVIKHFYACPPRKTPHIRAKRKQKKAPMSTAARGRACAPPGAAVRRLLLLLLLLGVVDVGSTAGREGVAAVGDGAAADGDGAELLAYARERAALCAGAQCAGAVVVGFANMGYSKFALNWVLSMRLIGLDNFVLVALDQRAHAYFSRLGVPSFYLASLGAGGGGLPAPQLGEVPRHYAHPARLRPGALAGGARCLAHGRGRGLQQRPLPVRERSGARHQLGGARLRHALPALRQKQPAHGVLQACTREHAPARAAMRYQQARARARARTHAQVMHTCTGDGRVFFHAALRIRAGRGGG